MEGSLGNGREGDKEKRGKGSGVEGRLGNGREGE